MLNASLCEYLFSLDNMLQNIKRSIRGTFKTKIFERVISVSYSFRSVKCSCVMLNVLLCVFFITMLFIIMDWKDYKVVLINIGLACAFCVFSV